MGGNNCLSSPRGRSSSRHGDVPRQAVLLGRRNRLLDPTELRNDLFADATADAGPDPDVLAIDVVSGRPELEPRPRSSLGGDDVLEDVVALSLRLDDDQPRFLQLAHLLRLDPAHPFGGEGVAARPDELEPEGAGGKPFCNKTVNSYCYNSPIFSLESRGQVIFAP